MVTWLRSLQAKRQSCFELTSIEGFGLSIGELCVGGIPKPKNDLIKVTILTQTLIFSEP